MKTSLLITLSIAALLGCGNAAPDEKPIAPTPAPVTSAPKVEDKPTTQAPHPGDNPSRIFQLRDLESTTLLANGHKVRTWIMDTDAKREEGMMFLTAKDVKDDQGMIFVFKDSSPRSFWMHNTILPLDIVYIDPKGGVLNVQKGKAENDTSLPSEGSAKYVLEVKQGIAVKLGIKKGTRITIPANVVAKD